MPKSSLKRNEEFFIVQQVHSGFRLIGLTGSTAVEREGLLVPLPSDSICDFGRLWIDYSLTSAGSAVRLELYVMPQDSEGSIPQIETLALDHYWSAMMNIVHRTDVGFAITNFHEESSIRELFYTPKDTTSNLYLYSLSNGTPTFNFLGRVEYDVFWRQQYYSDSYTKDGVRYTNGWDGYTYEESIQWMLNQDF